MPDHVYQNCFGAAGGGTGDWNSSLQCLSLKFENLWDAAVMKSLNTSMLLPESLPGGCSTAVYHQGAPASFEMVDLSGYCIF